MTIVTWIRFTIACMYNTEQRIAMLCQLPLPLVIENMTQKSNLGRKNRRDNNYGRAEAFAVLLLAADCASCPTLLPAVGISINGVTP
jgi:hypothetical protein